MHRYPESLITAFVTESRPSRIMEAAGIGHTKYYRLKNDPDFQKIVGERRTELINEAVLKMESYFTEAVETLHSVFTNPDTSPQTRINAVNVMMSQLASWKETTEILHRIEALEDVARETT